ncbi:unnamed protein product [Didymodactylos carnosus]|uniref:Uncharacterized protein n=1 Tax=Didymodactylos carnosus TaxID=1234261 RepID=A0A8S2DSW5_9BILA|nr:unnamed protein product [Didymodactylos carnosus]CAF3809536.1 unnamed protein product [Didymodactylos carnosus]
MKDAHRLTSPYSEDIIKLIELHFQQLGQSIGGKLAISLGKEKIDGGEISMEYILLRFKEPKRLIFNNEPLTPFLTIASEMMNNNRYHHLIVEGVKLITTQNQFVVIAALLAAYEVFNISYPLSTKFTLQTMTGIVFKTRDFNLSLGAQRFLDTVGLKHVHHV